MNPLIEMEFLDMFNEVYWIMGLLMKERSIDGKG